MYGAVGNGRERSTPACAGTTTPRTTRWLSQREHPRVCGDDFVMYTSALAADGAPPRVRGRHNRVPTLV